MTQRATFAEMKWTFDIQKAPGFRLNLIDMMLIAFLLAVSAAVFFCYPHGFYWAIPLYLGASFFLFCNVFRIGTRLEAPWWIMFLAITAVSARNPSQ